MKYLIKLNIIVFSVLITNACGGGGGGGTQQEVTNQARAVPFVNVNTSLPAILQLNTTYSGLSANSGYLDKATLIIRNEEVYPFVASGASKSVAIAKVFQMQVDDSSGRLTQQYIWKLHLDSLGKPLGVASTNEYGKWKNVLCMNSNSSTVLPASSNIGGEYFSGYSGSYYEDFRSGTYANYCDLSPTSTLKSVMWSIADGDPSPYTCLVFPVMWGPKTQLCFVTEANGALSGKPWIRTYSSDGTPSTDYKDTTGNRPYQVFSTVINPDNYWYGKVWRPSDGYTYKTYEDIKFSSGLACREQTQVNWRATYSAVNIAWSCVNVVKIY